MAIYIAIRKVNEGPDFADYTFGLSEGNGGRLRLNKINGNVSLLEIAPGDSENSLYQRAAHKIHKHWTAGEVPDNTCWAS
jgi:hypothetical protein